MDHILFFLKGFSEEISVLIFILLNILLEDSFSCFLGYKSCFLEYKIHG